MAEVTILIPNYKTLELTTLCLRLIRKFTSPDLAKVIVIDNDSQDESVEYLRRLKWIELIERPKVPGESGPEAHSRSLDLALSRVTTPFVLSIHTDTLVKRPDWLPFLLKKIKRSENIAGVGSWKLEQKSWFSRMLKTIERQAQKLYFSVMKKKQHAIEGLGDNFYYLRSHCALYRTKLLQDLQLGFSLDDAVAGKEMHKCLVDAGYEMIFLPSEELLPYLDHINHATMILNPELGASAETISKGRKRLAARLKIVDVEKILADDRLDG